MSNSNHEKRIAAWLEGRISEADSETLQQELRDSVEARTTFKRFAQLDAVLREVADTERTAMISQAGGSNAPIQTTATIQYIRGALAIAAGIAVMLTVTLYYQYVNANRNIARITGINGTLSWIGDGGQIVQGDSSQRESTRWSNTLSVGAELPGGTIEGMAPDSWFKLEFHDGSTGMISGDSILTFSDQGQKELRLRQGQFSADVMPQPEGKPMMIHTSVAVLRVIGTQFDVEAGLESTMLYVREGIVQITRVHDGKTIDVPANHRVVTTANSDMLLQFVAPERMWSQTPVWENTSSSGDQDSIATGNTNDYDGTRNLLVSEEAARLPAQDTEYTIRSGDLFEIHFVWMAGMWWTPQDQIAIRLFTTDNDLISGTPTTFATILSGTLTDTRAYEAASGSATATETEARKRLFIAIDTEDRGGELNGVAYLDNFQLQVTHFPEPGLPRLDDFRLQGTPFPDPLPPPAAEIIIGENIRNGNFNEN